MEPVTKFLTDPDAADYPFLFQIVDRLKSLAKNIHGTVQNAKYADLKQPGPSWLAYQLNDRPFSETNYIKMDNDELIVEMSNPVL